VLFDRPNWPQHRPWLIVFAVATMGSIAWFVAAGLDSTQWPGGNSLPGFTFGVAGGLIILFEFLLWLRRKVRTWRIGSAQTWLRAHIWLGLLCLPLLVLHSGLRLGGTLSTVLMALLVLVIASGIWGLILQNLLPKLSFQARSQTQLGNDAEAVYSQKDYLIEELLSQADHLVSATCGGKAEVPTEDSPRHEAGPVIVETVRFAGHSIQAPAAPIPGAATLAVFYREQVAPYLRTGTSSNSELADTGRAAVVFHSFKAQLTPAAHEIVDALECFCRQRRQWDSQARLHFWLHNWLWVHFPLSVALLVLMAVHVFVALKYW
jgi:hypothetical protein